MDGSWEEQMGNGSRDKGLIGTGEKFISLKLKERLISNKQVAVKEKWYLSNNFLSSEKTWKRRDGESAVLYIVW